MNDNTQSNYRWYILTLSALTVIITVSMPNMSIPVLFEEMANDLGLNVVQIGAVWGMVSLAAVFVMPVGGLISDRFGVRRVAITGSFFGGILLASVGLAVNFVTLVITVFASSILLATLPMNMHKFTGFWFTGKQLGIANGVVASSMGIGFTLGAMLGATVLSPLLHGWRNVLFLYGFLCIVLSAVWFFTGREPGQGTGGSPSQTVSFGQAVGRIVKVRNLWFLAFSQFGFGGCILGVMGYLPTYFKTIGWVPVKADATLAILNIASTLATLPIAFLSDRLGMRKALLLVALIVMTISVGLLSVAGNVAAWPLVICSGIFRDAFMAIMITMIIEMSGIGIAYVGSALGIVVAFQRIGGFISPPIGNSLATISPGLPFVFWAVLGAFSCVMFAFLREEKGTVEIEMVR
jgi:ACS family D-galactonate transporter-like MFS transporter